ncbi:DUF4129 domain-containing protein [Candidatus Formimonas warabiya]|uniref:Protein-glutamine gamma-glutamyltransferase-like C-terminal domain-containing protein n=1 Tax=Formimonas warabiya TaxID=1761012 RepID=A0A3G1KMP9_FORW1|nr:DUF4129 domain-containing protein [Candidatus Formimonas warabiya]ATW23727.1 hypothetical protein DCMF_01985 [Candidatus Formimonas warabiya]
MTNLWQCLEIICFIYPLTAVLNPAVGLRSTIIPWWLWGTSLALALAGNKYFLRRGRSVLLIIIFNMLLGTIFGIFPMIMIQIITSPAGWWPGALPGMVEIAILWPLYVFMLIEPLPARDRVRIFEIGLYTGALLLLAKQHFGLEISYFWFALGGFIFTGLINEAFAHSYGFSKKLSAFKLNAWFPFLLCVLLIAAGLFLGWIVATNRMANLLEKVIQAFMVCMGLLAQFIHKTGLDRAIGPTKIMPKIVGAEPVVTDAYFGDTTPLWVMIVLWTILAILLAVSLILAVKGLGRVIRNLMLMKQSLPSYQRNAFAFNFDRNKLAAQFKDILTYFFHKVRLFLQELSPLTPRGVYDLYYFFLKWGKRNGLGRTLGETPQEYFERLLPLFREKNPQLAESLSDLTAAYYLERYREDQQPFSKEKIKLILHGLSLAKLNESKK